MRKKTATLDQHFEKTLRRVRAEFKRTGEIYPRFKCVTDAESFNVPVNWPDRGARAAACAALRDSFRRRGVNRYLFVSEVWVGTTRGLRPADDPDRRECVQVIRTANLPQLGQLLWIPISVSSKPLFYFPGSLLLSARGATPFTCSILQSSSFGTHESQTELMDAGAVQAWPGSSHGLQATSSRYCRRTSRSLAMPLSIPRTHSRSHARSIAAAERHSPAGIARCSPR